MNVALGLAIFVVFALVGIWAKWYGMMDSLSMYSWSTQPTGRRFSLSSFLIAAISLAVGFGLFIMWLRRS